MASCREKKDYFFLVRTLSTIIMLHGKNAALYFAADGKKGDSLPGLNREVTLFRNIHLADLHGFDRCFMFLRVFLTTLLIGDFGRRDVLLAQIIDPQVSLMYVCSCATETTR